MNSLESLCYCEILTLLIKASLRKKEALLKILPVYMRADVIIALRCMTKASGRIWRNQCFHKGLLNHSFKKIISLLVEKDDRDTEQYLEGLRGHFLGFLLERHHDTMKWETDGSVMVVTKEPLKATIYQQFFISKNSIFEYVLFRSQQM
jgi:hypothetical protein